MTYVKICGLTNADLVRAARDADALGFVVDSPKSHRNLTHAQAAELVKLTGPFQTTVAVTSTRDVEVLHDIVRDVRPDALQVPFRAGQNAFSILRDRFPTLRLLISCRPEDAHLLPSIADAYVLDANTADGYGGTGQLTDWDRARAVRADAKVPIILAGGLTPENVAEAIRLVRPWGVDVASGVESAPGRKDTAKVRAFVDAVRGV